MGENGLKTLNVSESMIDMNEKYSQRVDNISSFQKVPGDFTIALCLFPGLGDNIHCIFVAYESCHHHISEQPPQVHPSAQPTLPEKNPMQTWSLTQLPALECSLLLENV